MNRSRRRLAAIVSLLVLLGLTGASLVISEGNLSPLFIAAVTLVKAVTICGVFLEMDRSRPLWAVLAGLSLLVIAGGSALLIAG